MDSEKPWLLKFTGLYLIAFGSAVWLIEHYIFTQAETLTSSLLPAYAHDILTYNQQLISFLLLVLFLISGIGLFWLVRLSRATVTWIWLPPAPIILMTAVVGALRTPVALSILLFIAAALCQVPKVVARTGAILTAIIINIFLIIIGALTSYPIRLVGQLIIAERHFQRRTWLAVSGLVVALNFIVGALALFAPTFEATIAPSAIFPEQGSAYTFPIIFGVSRLYRLPWDNAIAPLASQLTIYENNKPLGPAHSLHNDIRGKGHGRFSHWGQTLYFSASDGSDPRSNGRIYSITSPTRLGMRFPLALALLDLGFLIVFRWNAFATVRACARTLVSVDAATTLRQSLHLPSRNYAVLTAIAINISLIMIGAWASYPIRLADDYYELPERVSLAQGAGGAIDNSINAFVPRADVEQCLIRQSLEADLKLVPDKVEGLRSQDQVLPLSCPFSKALASQKMSSQLEFNLQATGGWDTQVGRLFFHHSYLFVPALHFLKYGLTTSMPYLYGWGNTLVHSAFLALFTPNLTTYFNTLPLTKLIGFIGIALGVSYISQDKLRMLVAFGLSIGFYYLINATASWMAPGVSPLRYLGLVAQAASIMFVFRSRAPWRWGAIPLGMLVSYFWNKEFAFIGYPGQLLALFSPQLLLSRVHRSAAVITAIVTVILTIGITVAIEKLSPGILWSINFGIFEIGVPKLSLWHFSQFLIYVSLGTTLLIFGAFQFNAGERDALICIISILVLTGIKYLFNPSVPVHLTYILVFVAPFALCCLPTAENVRASSILTKVNPKLATWFCVGLLTWCPLQAIIYRNANASVDETLIKTFEINTWSTLGESFQTTTPGLPITERVHTILAKIHPSDKLLLLSPFDHLIASYVNPFGYCGHFELLSNLVTSHDVETVLNCVRRSPSVLIVYDKALTIPCPEARFHDQVGCKQKAKLKATLQGIMTALEPQAVLVRETNELKLYRLRGSAGGE